MTGKLLAEHLYPLDKPKCFHRDAKLGDVSRADVKVCEMATVGADRTIVLERISATAKPYLVTLDPSRALLPGWSDPARRPTLEERSADGTLNCLVLDERLLLSMDDYPEVGPDLEGLTLLEERTILLVNDNDFGIEGAETEFSRVEATEPLDSE